MESPGLAKLFLNGQQVGTVNIKHDNPNWAWGDFHPEPAFSDFATLFGSWSLILHAGDKDPHMSDAASEELRDFEMKIDRLHAELRGPKEGQIIRISQLSIDGQMIEWRPISA
jgi:hypothetical protein